MASWERDLLVGLATELATAGAGTYRPTGAYLPTETAITFGAMPVAPDRVITLALYSPGGALPRQTLTHTGLQARVRGLPGDHLDAIDLDSAVFDALQGLTARQYGTCWLIQCLERSSVPMGQDASRRWEISHNYALDLNTPNTANRPE